MNKFRPGDVLRYVPKERHCWEGMAIVGDHGRAEDTFWLTGRKVVPDADLASARVVFNLADFVEVDDYYPFERIAPCDREIITAQHGLRVMRFVRIGAEADQATILANAREKVIAAESAMESATRAYHEAQAELGLLTIGEDH